MNNAIKLPILILFALGLAGCVTTGEIKHRFVATDESGKQLLYVDEFNPANDWTVALPGNRDIQLSGKGTVLVSVPAGYREYDLKTGKIIKEVGGYNAIQTLVRLGHDAYTILASKSEVIELGPYDKKNMSHRLAMGGGFRLLRVTSAGNLLYTSGKTTVVERKANGEMVRELDLKTLTPETMKPYGIEELPDGSFLASTGFGATILHLDKDWKLLKSYGGKGKVEGVATHFFADMQRLKNGNIVVAHWSGHARADSKKAPQALEFDKDGKVVWTWHDPERAGTFHGIEIIE